jgi:Doubled CXXCH motif (Paired_CXXCH_1)/Bacterial Ig-like domain
MKRTNYRRRLFSYIVISCVFLSSFLLYSPADVVLSAEGDPYLQMLIPNEAAVFDGATNEVTGSMSDDSTPAEQLSLKVYEKLDSSSEPIKITKEEMDEEENRGVIEPPAIEPVIPVTETLPTITEVEYGPRPYVVDMKIIPPGVADETGYLPVEDMTQVPLESKIMVVIKESGTLNYSQPIFVLSSKGEIKSKEDLEGTIPQKNEDGDYIVIFTPSSKLDPSTTYYVYVNSAITNDLGQRIFPKYFKFTTTNVYHIGDIHGNYANNTNACAYCHSTHNGETPTLEGGEYGATEDNFCMVCHDGTNGSPMPDKYNSANKHNQHAAADAKNSDSCTSCHNPHAAWTAENPARLQSDQEPGTSHFQTLAYKKAGTATGKAEDFTLCLNCHDGKKASNIKQYYEDEALLAESGHNITAADGSALNGQLACADCHETHGSNNMMLLREELGNVKAVEADKYKTTGTAWDAINERQFCLKCHNNTTEVYGKTGTIRVKNTEGEPIPGHQSADIQSCSTCHGGTANSYMEAAHGPKKGIYVEIQVNR